MKDAAYEKGMGIHMEKLIELIEQQNWQKAKEYLDAREDTVGNDNPVFYILAAEVMRNVNEHENVFSYIAQGLKIDAYNYELYFMLGNYYAENNNPDKAYLCYEMAAFYARTSEDEKYLSEFFMEYKKTKSYHVKPISIIIVSYNIKEVMQNCIQSIRETTPASAYELVVIDNASSDGVKEWLQKQEDIIFAANETNEGFAKACNQGVELAKKENDIFFLNNDTIVPPNAIFWLRMGLYENEKTGAVGSVSNFAGNHQKVEEEFHSVDEWLAYACKVNVPRKHYYEKKIWLVGFALLIKRQVLDQVGLFDLRFGIGNFEDNDLGMRILQNGYELHLCKNSFIYHYGFLGFKQRNQNEYLILLGKNREKLIKKWGFNINYYMTASDHIISLIDAKKDAEINVLEIGCGAGATLAKIQSIWHDAKVCGIELNSKVALLGSNYLDITEGNIETMSLEYEQESFDYIIFGDVLEHLHNPNETLQKIIPFLKKGGCVLASIPNIMHVSVLLPLLNGKFEYQESGILDKTHIRFFTLESIYDMMYREHFHIEEIFGTIYEGDIPEENRGLYDMLTNYLGGNFAMQCNAYQYVFRARKQ